MERRSFQRMTADIQVRFYCNKSDYAGRITDLSENGLFIRLTRVTFPFDSELSLRINKEKKVLKVPVKVRRMTKSQDVFDGIGAQVTSQTQEYIDFVRSLKSST